MVLAALLILPGAAPAPPVLAAPKSTRSLRDSEIETVEVFSPSRRMGNCDFEMITTSRTKDVIERSLVRSVGGAVLFPERLPAEPSAEVLSGRRGWRIFERTVHLSDGTRARCEPGAFARRQPLLIRLAHSEEPLCRLKAVLLASLVVLPLVLIVAMAGYGPARRALSPIEQMARRAQEITESFRRVCHPMMRMTNWDNWRE
jgi:hypothetical protein